MSGANEYILYNALVGILLINLCFGFLEIPYILYWGEGPQWQCHFLQITYIYAEGHCDLPLL